MTTTAEERAEWLQGYEYYNRGAKPEAKRVRRLITDLEAAEQERERLEELTTNLLVDAGNMHLERDRADEAVALLQRHMSSVYDETILRDIRTYLDKEDNISKLQTT